MRCILAKGIGLDKSCNKVSLECGLEAQLGCYCGYSFTFQANYGKWSIDYDGGSVYKVSEFEDRCLYVAKKEEFESLDGYVLLYIGSDEHLKSIYCGMDRIAEELLK